MRQRRHQHRMLGLVAVLALVGATAAACSNTKTNATAAKPGVAGQTCTSTDERAGVTATTINVGGMASRTNPLNYDYGEAFDGTRAYFAMVNSQGGVFGRKLNLAEANDVGFEADPSAVTKLLSSQPLFAVAPVAALLFPGASLLAQQCVPTFGWNINAEWADGPSLFGDKGSNLDFTAPMEGTAWLAKTLGKKRVGVLGYNISSSAQCVQGGENTWKRYPNIATDVYNDAALPYPLTDVSGDVSKLKQAGADFVEACVDTNGMVTIAREMQKQDYHPVLDLADGYYNQIKTNPIFNGSYVVTFFTPLETQNPPAGLREYETWMKRTGGRETELSIAGWVSADMLVTGIRAAGPNFTRSSVVAALNRMTNYTANGVLPGINWTIAHTNRWNPPCSALSVVENGQFVPKFGQPGKPFVCFPLTPPAGPLPNPTIK